MDFSFAPLARHLGMITLITGLLAAWSLTVPSLFAAPLAVLFVLSAFGWSLVRLDGGAPAPAGPSTRRRHGCPGCAAGCVQCRERIDLGEAA